MKAGSAAYDQLAGGSAQVEPTRRRAVGKLPAPSLPLLDTQALCVFQGAAAAAQLSAAQPAAVIADRLQEQSGLPTSQCATLATPELPHKRALEWTNPATIGVGARH